MTAVPARPRVLLLCGGRSDEHDVSLASARSVLEAAGNGFDVTPLVIDRGGRLLPPAASRRALGAPDRPTEAPGDERAPQRASGAPRSPTEAPSDAGASQLAPGAASPTGPATAGGPAPALGAGGVEGVPVGLARVLDAGFDVVFPLLHGPYGEDGSVQGLLRLTGVPFVGSGVLGSAVGMDKLVMKSVFAAHGLPQVRYEGVTRRAWDARREDVLDALSALPFPLFVKPANLGSSIGIRRADDRPDLIGAVDAALAFDRRVIVEEGVTGARELEVGVLGNDEPDVSPVGEIAHHSAFYDFATKYTDGRADLVIPAELPEGVSSRCRDLAARAFRAVDAAGLARVDFFYRETTDTLLVNEINTMPGFTRHSMYPKLWGAAGVSYADLIARLVELALERR